MPAPQEPSVLQAWMRRLLGWGVWKMFPIVSRILRRRTFPSFDSVDSGLLDCAAAAFCGCEILAADDFEAVDDELGLLVADFLAKYLDISPFELFVDFFA